MTVCLLELKPRALNLSALEDIFHATGVTWEYTTISKDYVIDDKTLATQAYSVLSDPGYSDHEITEAWNNVFTENILEVVK